MVHHEEIRDAQRVRPFQPFDLHLADGRRFRVAHPETLFVTRSGRTVVFENAEGHVEMIDTVLITSVATPVPYEAL